MSRARPRSRKTSSKAQAPAIPLSRLAPLLLMIGLVVAAIVWAASSGVAPPVAEIKPAGRPIPERVAQMEKDLGGLALRLLAAEARLGSLERRERPGRAGKP